MMIGDGKRKDEFKGKVKYGEDKDEVKLLEDDKGKGSFWILRKGKAEWKDECTGKRKESIGFLVNILEEGLLDPVVPIKRWQKKRNLKQKRNIWLCNSEWPG